MVLLQKWLNSSQDYWQGIALLAQVAPSHPLLPFMRQGNNARNQERLRSAILAIYKPERAKPSPVIPAPAKEKKIQHFNAVYEAAKLEADMAYKAVMNMRAELFAMTRAESWEDVNTPDKVQQRAALAIDVVAGYRRASALYEKANFVLDNGYLPAGHDAVQEEDFSGLKDVHLERAISNLRKNISKRKKMPPTPERIQLIEKHESTLTKLLARWNTLS